MPMQPDTALITGASSGLGAALAVALAAQFPGIRLALQGRSLDRLREVTSRCETLGARVQIASIDVTDTASLEAWLLEIDEQSPIDLVIANAGISGGTAGVGRGDRAAQAAGETAAQTRAIFATNIDGVANTVLPLLPRMAMRGQGQVGIMASLAGFRGLPGTPAYCASKAAVKVWGESLRVTLADHGVGVSVICPGFVATPLTQGNRFPMPFLMSDGRAAQIMLRGLLRNKGRISFPLPTALAAWFMGAAPDALAGWLAGRLAPRQVKPPLPSQENRPIDP